jgi:Tripartite tricarboxylate transporter TctB family
MTEKKHSFAGEDENTGFASPGQDLLASVVLIALSIWVMVESLRLEMPGNLSTAPGLLPFLTAATLCLMALALAWLAIKRQGAGTTGAGARDETMPGRAPLLMALVGAYLLSLQFVSFEYSTTITGFRLSYGSFEVLSIIALTVVLTIFWQPRIWPCLAVSAVWVTALAAVFRYVFVMPLPGV